ncbi:hypothetical protein ACOSQ4_004757 [Xanthoceras sorbifolium]
MLEYEHETKKYCDEIEKHRGELEAANKKIQNFKDERASKAELAKKKLKALVAQAGDDLGNANKLVEMLKDDLVKKDEELKETHNEAYDDILYNVWLQFPNLDYNFLGPAMTKWIEVFKTQHAEAEVE